MRRIFGYDAGLVLAVALLLGGSILLLATAIVRPDGGVDNSFAHRQLVFGLLGIGVAVAISRIPIDLFERYWLHAWVLGCGGIASVIAFGSVVNGARRWIDVGPVALQPSEFAKILIIIAAAGFMATRYRDIRSPRLFLSVLALCAVPAMLVFIQPDFGTAQVFGYIALGTLFFAGARWFHFAVLAGVVITISFLILGLLPAVGVEVLHDYQKQRLTGFLDPEADPQGTNYQTIQAKIAIGSGGVAGRADGEATQVKQAFLPEPQTDFIFATLVESHGFLAGGALLAAYLLLISRCLQAVSVASTPFGRIVAGGIVSFFCCQVVINVGMVVGVLPVTGVPLPLFSYGGSSVMANLMAVGLIASIMRESESAQVRYSRRAGASMAQALRSVTSGPRGVSSRAGSRAAARRRARMRIR